MNKSQDKTSSSSLWYIRFNLYDRATNSQSETVSFLLKLNSFTVLRKFSGLLQYRFVRFVSFIQDFSGYISECFFTIFNQNCNQNWNLVEENA